MEKTLKVLNELERRGLIRRYAIGGGIATFFYTEPVLTYDLDVFVFLPAEESKIISLSPIYDYLKRKGYREDKEHIVVEGIPIQFIPAYNLLVEEAVREAREVKYKGVKTRVVQAEHLVAIMLQTGRAKDKVRMVLFLEEAKINRSRLTEVIKRHHLNTQWNRFQKK